jgi:hypothetical protein
MDLFARQTAAHASCDVVTVLPDFAVADISGIELKDAGLSVLRLPGRPINHFIYDW